MSVHFSSFSHVLNTDRAEEPAPTEPDPHAIHRESINGLHFLVGSYRFLLGSYGLLEDGQQSLKEINKEERLGAKRTKKGIEWTRSRPLSAPSLYGVSSDYYVSTSY